MTITLGKTFLEELEAEAVSTRKCIERVPAKDYNWKPHEKSMLMGYLTSLLAEIPRWLTSMVEIGEINFATWTAEKYEGPEDLVKIFDTNMDGARKALSAVSDEEMEKMFSLKHGETVLMSMTKKASVSSTINHLVHHRGQLTVYMRLNDIAVPSIYGPTADEKGF